MPNRARRAPGYRHSNQRGIIRISLLTMMTAMAATTADDCQQPTTQGDTVCYPGADQRYNTCYTLDPMPAPPPSDYVYPSTCEPSYGSNYQTPAYLLDLSSADPSEYLAPNFQLGELAQEWKGQYAVLQVHAVESLQRIRDIVGPLNVNSGYRSPGYNASVDGATCSRHMYGDAFDMYPSYASLGELADACRTVGADFVQVYATWVHCDWRYDRLDDAYYRMAGAPGIFDDIPVMDARIVLENGRWSAPATGWDEGEPLRQWTAFDARGNVLLEATGTSFVAPTGTAEVSVVVGLEFTLRAPVPDTI